MEIYKQCKLIVENFNKPKLTCYNLFDMENTPIILNTKYCLPDSFVNKLELLYPDYCSIECDVYIKYRSIIWNTHTNMEQYHFGYETEDDEKNFVTRWVIMHNVKGLIISTYNPREEKDVVVFTKKELDSILGSDN